MARHATLTGSNLHEPKGVATAPANRVYVTDGAASGTFKAYYAPTDLSTNEVFEELLVGYDTTTQNPTGLNVTTRVKFGAAQGSVSDPVMVDATGVITFNEAGSYFVQFRVQFGRTGGAGTSILHIRNKIDGVVVITPTTKLISSSDVISDSSFSSPITVTTPGTTLEVEIVRDPAGNNSGGLIPYVATATGWADSPSADFNIGRYVYTIS